MRTQQWFAFLLFKNSNMLSVVIGMSKLREQYARDISHDHYFSKYNSGFDAYQFFLIKGL